MLLSLALKSILSSLFNPNILEMKGEKFSKIVLNSCLLFSSKFPFLVFNVNVKTERALPNIPKNQNLYNQKNLTYL